MFEVIITNHKTNRKNVVRCATIEDANKEKFMTYMTNDYASVEIFKDGVKVH